MRNIEAIKRTKGAKAQEARGLVELAEKENRNLSQEEKAKVDNLLAEIKEIDEDITREERLQAVEMRKITTQPVVEDRKKEKRAAFFKYVREGRSGLNPEERALVEDATGLYMVPEDLQAEIYRSLPQLNVLRQICNVRPTTRDKVAKRSITEVSVGWGKLETGTLITESTLAPSKDYIYVEDLYGLTKVGEDELMDSDDILAGIIADSFARAIADAEARAFVIGTGHAYSQPDGITLDATVIANYIDLDTADTMVPDDLIDLEYALPSQYRNGACFMLHPTTEGQVRKVKATSSYLWQPSLQQGMPRQFDGFPMYNSNDLIVPASDNTDRSIVGLFGNFRAGYTIVDRLGITIQRLNELYAEEGLIGFKVHFRVGGGVVRPDAFRALDNNT